jgi:UDP-N-acetylglucosamine:LPS N-acetylglucosamine transferase
MPRERGGPDAAERRSEVVIVSGSLGAGHDSAAAELALRLRDLQIRASVIDYLSRVPSPISVPMRAGYYATASHAPFLLEALFRSSQWSGGEPPAAMALMARTAARRLLPDLAGARVVVSTFPFATQAIGRLRGQGLPAVTASYLTDPAAHRVWLHPAVDHHLVVTDPTRVSAQAYGFEATVVGPLVSKEFRRPLSAGERAELRTELAVPQSRVLALLMSGSHGMGQIGNAADAVRRAGAAPVVLCGSNDRLRRTLQARGITALGWRTDVHRLMHAADVLVHNSGGLSFTESLVVGLPAVTYMPIAGHGLLNAQVLHDSGLSPWARSAEDLGTLIGRLGSRAGRPIAEAGETAASFIAGLCDER